jgi:hypothetical protein
MPSVAIKPIIRAVGSLMGNREPVPTSQRALVAARDPDPVRRHVARVLRSASRDVTGSGFGIGRTFRRWCTGGMCQQRTQELNPKSRPAAPRDRTSVLDNLGASADFM